MSRVSGRKHARSYLGTIIHHIKDESAKPQRSGRDFWKGVNWGKTQKTSGFVL